MGRYSGIAGFTMQHVIDLHKEGRNQQYIPNYLKCAQPSVNGVIKQYFNEGYFEKNIIIATENQKKK